MSRYEDCEAGMRDTTTYSSGRGNIIELIKAGFEMPPGVLIYEDPPVHTIHRSLMSRVFTPKKMAALEDKVRAFSAECLDPHVGSDGLRLHRRPRRARPDEDDRDAARHPRRGPASDP